jgi:hypothetical protein
MTHGHDWGNLSAGQKKFYTEQGVTAGSYNRWWAQPQLERTQITKAAQASGYKSGLQFYAVQTQVKTWAGKRIKTSTPPREAARLMYVGTKGATARRQRNMTARLFRFDEFDRVDWENFLSP